MTLPPRVRYFIVGFLLLGYAAVSFKLGAFYPFSSFDLFAFSEPADSRLIVRLPDGALAEVRDFSAWACAADAPTLEPPEGAACPDAPRKEHQERLALRYIRRHALGDAPGNEVVVGRQVVSYREDVAKPQVHFCPLFTCGAAR